MTRARRPVEGFPGRARLDLSREEPREPRRRRTLLSPPTSCAASPAQSPPCDVDVRTCISGSLPTGHSVSNRQPPRLEPIATHRKQIPATRPNSQLSALFESVHPQPPVSRLSISNRPYRRLEINISATKQRTAVLSNRPKSADPARLALRVRRGRIGVLRDQRESKDLSFAFFRTNQPARQHCGGPARRLVRRSLGEGARLCEVGSLGGGGSLSEGGPAGSQSYTQLVPAAISWRMAWAAARGSGAAVIGRPTTR
jgi:hypothetical protein